VLGAILSPDPGCYLSFAQPWTKGHQEHYFICRIMTLQSKVRFSLSRNQLEDFVHSGLQVTTINQRHLEIASGGWYHIPMYQIDKRLVICTLSPIVWNCGAIIVTTTPMTMSCHTSWASISAKSQQRTILWRIQPVSPIDKFHYNLTSVLRTPHNKDNISQSCRFCTILQPCVEGCIIWQLTVAEYGNFQ
jgi:hypothetical protein